MAENASFDVLIDEIRQPFLLYATTRKKERDGKVHKVTRRYILAICGADTPGPIPIKFGMRVAPSNIINVSSFCNRIFRGFRSTEGQSPRFPIDFAGHRYNSAALPHSLLRAACDKANKRYYKFLSTG